MLVVSSDDAAAAMRAVCRCLPSGQPVYEFQFTARPALIGDSVILSSDGVNLVVCAVKSTTADESATDDSVIFIVRRVVTGHVVTKARPNYPEFRYNRHGIRVANASAVLILLLRHGPSSPSLTPSRLGP